MFRTYVFTEMSYPYVPPADLVPNNRVELPNRFYDPDAGYQIYRGVYDLYAAADGLGLDVMLNEHHSTATCTNAVVPLSMSIVARETTNARILALGNPVAHRTDPVRVAEEMATVDVISRGRTEIGFVKGVPQEVLAVNSTAIDIKERYWEAVDLILKAWTTHDGPFSWEGRFFHHRQVNIWPRPYQQPHPPVWVPTMSTGSAREVASRGFKLATLATGTAGCASIFKAYREQEAEMGVESSLDNLAYSPMVFVGDTDEEALREAKKLQLWFKEAGRHSFQYSNPPGYLEPAIRAQMLKALAEGKNPRLLGRQTPLQTLAEAPIEELIEGGFFLAGNPDSVFKQLRTLFDGVGGFGNILAMAHYGSMSPDLSIASLKRWSEHVVPRFNEEVYRPTVQGRREMVPSL